MAEGGRLDHLTRRGSGDRQTFPTRQHPPGLGPLLAEHQQGVLDHHDRAVDQKAEVQRAEAHQVSADAEAVHADDREQEADRDHQGGDRGRADVAEQQEQNHDHQQGAFDQVLGDRRDGLVDERTPVQDRFGDDARRQARGDFLEAFGGGLGHRPAVAAGQHQRRTDDRFVAVAACAAETRRLADFDGGDIGDPHDQPVTVDHGGLGEIRDGLRQGVGSDGQGFTGPLNIARTGLGVGPLQSDDEVVQAQAVSRQTRGVRPNRILLHIAAVHIDAGQALRGPHARGDDPVLDRAEIGRAGLWCGQQFAFGRQIGAARLPAGLSRFGEIGAVERFEVDRPHEDFAEAGGDRRERRLHALRQPLARLGHPFGHLLASEVDVRAVGEDDSHLAKAVSAERPGSLDPRDARHGGFEGIGDLAFHLLGRERRGDGVDLDLPVGDVRHGVDGQLRQVVEAEGGDNRRRQNHEPSEANRGFDNRFEHDAPLVPVLGFALGHLGLEQEGVG